MKLKVALLLVVAAVLAYRPLHSRADDGDDPPVKVTDGGGDDPAAATDNPADPGGLTQAEVAAVVQAAAESINSSTLVIAVTNRRGDVLALYPKPEAPAHDVGNFGQLQDSNEVGSPLARHGSVFSHRERPPSPPTLRLLH